MRRVVGLPAAGTAGLQLLLSARNSLAKLHTHFVHHGCHSWLCCAPQVDDRMNGDGTGKILGINDPVLFWVLAGKFMRHQ